MIKLRDVAALTTVSLLAAAPVMAQQAPHMATPESRTEAGVGQPNQGVTQSNPAMTPGMPANETAEPNSAMSGVAGQSGGTMSLSSLPNGEVKELQQALKAQGFYEHGNVDGIAGAGTRQALEQFQRHHGMQPSTRLNEQTMAALGLRGGEMQGTSGVNNPAMNGPNGTPGAMAGQHQMQSNNTGMSAGPGAPEGTRTGAMQNPPPGAEPNVGQNGRLTGSGPGMASNGPGGETANGQGAASGAGAGGAEMGSGAAGGPATGGPAGGNSR